MHLLQWFLLPQKVAGGRPRLQPGKHPWSSQPPVRLPAIVKDSEERTGS